MRRWICFTASMALFGGLVVGCGGDDPPKPECATALDCPHSECELPVCANQTCGTTPAPERYPCPVGSTKMCDGHGACVACLLDIDCGAGKVCDNHACVAAPTVSCSVSSDCPEPPPCMNKACVGELCKPTSKPYGTTCAIGEKTGRCDGDGVCVDCFSDFDCPAPAGDCETAICVDNACGTTAKATGATCNSSGGKVCNAGLCVQCITNDHCATGTVCNTENRCTAVTTCGNGMLDAGEVCDGALLNGKTCASVMPSAPAGQLACRVDCSSFDTSGCSMAGCPLAADLGSPTQSSSAMGNDDYQTQGLVNVGIAINSSTAVFFELYDGVGFFTSGFAPGTYALTGMEASYSTCSLCAILQWQNPSDEDDYMLYMPKSGTVHATALTTTRFEGTMSNMQFAEVQPVQGLPFEEPGCKTKIQSMAFNAAIAPASCGNGVVDSYEHCEGANVRGMTCALAGRNGGPVTCDATVCGFNFSACTMPVCGNGVIEPGESCDGAQLGGKTCASLGYVSGALSCNQCQLVTSSCTAPTCSVANSLGAVTPVDSLAFVSEYSVDAYFDLNTDPDTVIFQLFPGYGAFSGGSLAAGTYTIQGDDLAFETCGLCVLIAGQAGQTFMATGGSFTLSQAPSGPNFVGSMSNVAFRQVTIDQQGYSTPVPGGCTTFITSMSFNTPRY